VIINWIDVPDSERIVAIAYDREQEQIYVRFKKGGVEWWYGSCPPQVWEQFAAPGVSKGRFIREVLDNHPNGRHVG
jgi:hypothetical protein